MKTKLPLIPTLFTIPALIVLLCLGSWQVKRLMWKNNLVAEISERSALQPLELPGSKIDIDSLRYRRVIATGHFLHDKEIHVFTGAREMRGEAGYNIVTPLENKDGTVVLVDRGWVPADKKDSANRPETLLKGEISILGMLQDGEKKGMFTPQNDLARNLWFWIDIPAIAGFTGKPLENVYVRAIEDKDISNPLPIPGKATVEIRNDHLQYAIIWYSFAVILSVVYTIYVKNLGKESKTRKAKSKKKSA